MAIQTLPPVVAQYAASLTRENGAATSAALRLWGRMGENFDASFLEIAPPLIAVMNAAQLRVSTQAQAYIPQVLAATGQAAADAPTLSIPVGAFVGTAADGYPTETLAWGAVTTAKSSIAKGSTIEQALGAGGRFLSLAVGSLISDTSRMMESLETQSRNITHYVRALTPPSCGRCVVLAGKRVRSINAFQRHPGCDCRHIPDAENVFGDLTTGPSAYLNSLSEDELRKVLGSKANSVAWSDYNASATHLINAYRRGGDVRPGQIYGRNIKYTTDGTSVRGVAAAQMRRVRELSATARDGGRYRRVVAPRLMPESIFKIAGSDRARAEQMLRDYGWLGYTRAAA